MQPAGPIDLGNSGTGMRLLTGFLAGRPVDVELVGDASLTRRPMKRIAEPMRQMGGRVTLSGEHGTAPIHILGGELKGITYELPIASAQVKSCILLAGLFAEGRTEVIEPAPSRDHTERLMRRFDIAVDVEGGRVGIDGSGRRGPDIRGQILSIPGDFSSAAFWLVAAAAEEGRRVLLRGVGLNPRRTGLLDVLKRMGADIEVFPYTDPELLEPCGDIEVRGASLKGIKVGGDLIPNLIDELPLVAVAGALAKGKTVIRDAAELRVKESDRISCMAANLASMGVAVEETDDGMIVQGGASLRAPDQAIQSRGDHRIAMAMAVLALYQDDPVYITNVACTETSYPGFWEHLHELGADVD